MWAMVFSLVFCLSVVSDKLAVPDSAGQDRAVGLIDEVYGKQLEAARTPDQKATLAREILQMAREESDAANKYVGLMTARRLAVEANMGALALEVVQLQVAAFADELDGDAEGLLRRADMLWDTAETKRGQEQLKWRIDAVEAWLRSGEKSAILSRKWEARIAQVRETWPEPKPLQLSLATTRMLRTLNGATVAFINRKSGLAINVARNDLRPGASIIQWIDPQSSKNSHWLIEVLETGHCRFRNRRTGLWLAAIETADKIPRVTQLQKADRNGLWEIRPLRNDCIAVVHTATNLCLGPKGGSADRGAEIHLQPFAADTAHLQWIIVPILVNR